jgi:hypothetical protein
MVKAIGRIEETSDVDTGMMASALIGMLLFKGHKLHDVRSRDGSKKFGELTQQHLPCKD